MKTDEATNRDGQAPSLSIQLERLFKAHARRSDDLRVVLEFVIEDDVRVMIPVRTDELIEHRPNQDYLSKTLAYSYLDSMFPGYTVEDAVDLQGWSFELDVILAGGCWKTQLLLGPSLGVNP